MKKKTIASKRKSESKKILEPTVVIEANATALLDVGEKHFVKTPCK
jgi:hypothetical protein